MPEGFLIVSGEEPLSPGSRSRLRRSQSQLRSEKKSSGTQGRKQCYIKTSVTDYTPILGDIEHIAHLKMLTAQYKQLPSREIFTHEYYVRTLPEQTKQRKLRENKF